MMDDKLRFLKHFLYLFRELGLERVSKKWLWGHTENIISVLF